MFNKKLDYANSNSYHLRMNAFAQLPARLLIIEDDAVLGGHLRDFLSDRKYQVSLCADGAVGLGEAASGQYDLVLLDILLPGLNGLELLAELRKQCPVPVIVVSALGDYWHPWTPAGQVTMRCSLHSFSALSRRE